MVNDSFDMLPLNQSTAPWSTVPFTKRVLLITHNVTTLTRLLDILPAFENDPRIQLIFTSLDSDPFRHDIEKAIQRTGMISIPWKTAMSTDFDLAISASHHAGVTETRTPLVLLSHGIGYTKYSPNSEQRTANSEQRTANSEQRTANSEQRTANSDIFGLSPQWVLRNGQPAARALVFSHPSQVAQLELLSPAARPAAVVAGDPCYDRIVASLPFRSRYRKALGVGDRSLVYISSTWSGTSTLGRRFDLARELLAELPRDRYAVAISLHPNIRHHHGPGQIIHWFADCRRAGLLLLPEIDGWRAGLIAADIICGDNGSVTGYGAAIGRPVALAEFPESVPPGTAIAEMGRLAPRLPPHGPYRQFLDGVIHQRVSQFDTVADLVTSEPGQALSRLRALFYHIMELPEPSTDVPSFILPAPEIDQPPLSFADFVSVEQETSDTFRLTRRPAEVRRPYIGLHDEPRADAEHLSCSVDYPIRTLVDKSDVIIGYAADHPDNDPSWMRTTLSRFPGSALTALIDAHTCTVLLRTGEVVLLESDEIPAEVLPSVIFAWIDSGQPISQLPRDFRVMVGARVSDARCTTLSTA